MEIELGRGLVELMSRSVTKPIVQVLTRCRVYCRFSCSPVVFAVVFCHSSQFKDVLKIVVTKSNFPKWKEGLVINWQQCM